MKKPLIKLNLEISDIFSLSLILLYAIYAYVGNVVIDCESRSTLIDHSCIPTYIIYIISFSVLGILLFNIFKGNWTTSRIGLNLGKGFWVVLGVAIVLGFLLSYKYQTVSVSALLDILPSLFYYTGSEIVLRAFLIYRIMKILGQTEAASRFAIIISAVLFAFTHETYSGNILVMYGTSILLSAAYFYSRSVFILVIFDLYTSVIHVSSGSEQLSYFPLIGMMTLLFYLLLAVPGNLMDRRNAKSFQVQ